MPEYYDGPGFFNILVTILFVVSLLNATLFFTYIICRAFTTSFKWGFISLLFPIGFILFIGFNWKHTKITATVLTISICIFFWSFFEFFGPDLNSVANDVKEVGIEKIEKEARDLLSSNLQEEILPQNKYPDAISKLSPCKVLVYKDRNYVTLILKRFNGTTGTGLYICFDQNTQKWPAGNKKISKHIIAYKIWD